MKQSNITINVSLDEDKHPVKIQWRADDDNGTKKHESKAMLVSFFDKDSLDTLKIDLWTKEMQVNEMDRFFFQTLRSMCDTYFRSTNNDKLAAQMQNFTQYFGEETGILKKESS